MGVGLDDISFEIAVHVATALALCVVLRKELKTILLALLPVGIFSDSVGAETKARGRVLLVAVVVGTIPAVLAGLAFTGPLEAVFHDVRLTLAMLPATGVFLIATRMARDRTRSVSLLIALAVGTAQAVAILPGISRSGLTIGAALFLGVKKEEAVKFSFLLSLPAILGGALLHLVQAGGAEAGPSAGAILVGSAAAFVCALGAASLLLGLVRRGKLEYFGYYCVCVGAVGLLYTRL